MHAYIHTDIVDIVCVCVRVFMSIRFRYVLF